MSTSPAVLSGTLAGPEAEIALRAPYPGEARDDPYQTYLDRFPGKPARRVMAGCLDHIAAMLIEPTDGNDHVTGAGCAWWLLRYRHTERIRAMLINPERGWSPAYINKHLSALRGVLKVCWKAGLMSTDDYARAADLANVKGKRALAGRSIHPDEITALLASCEQLDGPLQHRDSLIFIILQSTGMRREEITSALIERYDPRERKLLIIGKGNKEEPVWIHKDAVPYLDRWLALVDERTGPIFRGVDRWGNIRRRALSVTAISDVVERHRLRAGLPPLSPHDFRRTFVGELYDAKADSQQARKLARHEHSSTTDKYDRRGERGLRDLIDRLPIVLPASAQKP